MKINPTVGRVVWFREVGAPDDTQPQAATVAYVHSDSLVNLSVVDHEGYSRPKLDVPLVQEGDDLPSEGHYCEWMPYQKAVASGEIQPTLHADANAQTGETQEA